MFLLDNALIVIHDIMWTMIKNKGLEQAIDRIFSKAVLNGMYSFHRSSAAYAEFWNDSFWSTQQEKSRKISCWQIWQAFVHESLHTVAKVSDINLVLPDGLPIGEVT